MLDVTDLHAGYGPLPVLDGISLSLRPGEVITVLGRNGAGKTTLLRTLTGQLPTTSGTARLAGEPITGLPPYRIARKGLAYVPQGRGIFPKLTVEENLTLGTRVLPDRKPVVAEEIFERFPILHERRRQLAGTLSGGQQQQLALGRALAGRPRLLLLDEPSEGIQPNIVDQIGAFLRDFVAGGETSVLLVEQNLTLGLAAGDRFVFVEKGRVVHEAMPDEMKDEEMLSRYLAV